MCDVQGVSSGRFGVSCSFLSSRAALASVSIVQSPSTLSTGEVQVQDWQGAGWLKPSVLKPVLTTIDPALVLKKLGRLTSPDQPRFGKRSDPVRKVSRTQSTPIPPEWVITL